MPIFTPVACGMPSAAAGGFASPNPSDASGSITFVGGNLVMAASAAPAVVRSTISLPSAKIYCEFTSLVAQSGVTTDMSYFGIANATHSLSDTLGTTAHSLGYRASSGIKVNNSTIASASVWSAAGVTGQMHIDNIGKLVWARAAGSGDWNGSGTADPATGVGGIDISGISGSIYLAVQPGDFSTPLTFAIAVNFGSAPFKYSPATGYTGLSS